MKNLFALLLGLMFCFVFTTVNAATQTQNKDVGITCVNQVFTPATSIENTIIFQKASDVKQIYSGSYDSGIGLINREYVNYTQTLDSDNQIYQRAYRQGIGKLNDFKNVTTIQRKINVQPGFPHLGNR